MGWIGGLSEWQDGDTVYLSVAFTWKLEEAYYRARFAKLQGLKVRAGGPALFLTKMKHRLAGKNWPVTDSKEWLGNWCWNAYRVGDLSKTTGWWMVDFATWLRGRGLFGCTHGPEVFFEWFNGDLHLTPAEVHTAIFDAVPGHP